MVTQETSAPKQASERRRARAATPSTSARVPTALTGRRRPAVWGAGLALIAVGAALAATAVLSSGAKHGVLIVVRAVPAGRTITGADLGAASLPTVPGLSPLPVAARISVLGQRAAVDLVPGTLLTAAELSSQGIPGPGQSLIGVAFKPGLMPSRPLQRGDNIELVTVTQDAGTSTSSGSGAEPEGQQDAAAERAATVDAESEPAADGTVTVDVVVPAQEAAGITQDAAAGRLALVLLPRSSR